MDDLITRHSALNAFCRDVAILTIFSNSWKLCVEELLFSHHTDQSHQNYRIHNKLLEHRNGEISLNIADIERAEITLSQHVQRSVFGKIYTKLSLDAEKYVKAVSQIKNTHTETIYHRQTPDSEQYK